MLVLSLSCLLQGGKYLTHLTGKAVPHTRETFKALVDRVAAARGLKVQVTFSEAFVPSFMEVWLFAQVTLVAA